MQHSLEYDKKIYIIVSQNIKKYRRVQRITQKELAMKCGYSHAYIRRIEGPNCPKSFSIQTISNICNALNVEVSSIFKNDNI